MGDVANTKATFECKGKVIGVAVSLDGKGWGVLSFPIFEEVTESLGRIVGRAVGLSEGLVGGVDAVTVFAGADFSGLVGDPITFFDDAFVGCAEELMCHCPASRDKRGERTIIGEFQASSDTVGIWNVIGCEFMQGRGEHTATLEKICGAGG